MVDPIEYPAAEPIHSNPGHDIHPCRSPSGQGAGRVVGTDVGEFERPQTCDETENPAQTAS